LNYPDVFDVQRVGTYPEFANAGPGAEAPLALVLQREYLGEPQPGQFMHVRKERITEWRLEFLRGLA
jgi:hypothetical protein